jgi:hypothetical protein
VRTVSVVADVDLPPARALRLWTDTSRWPTFVDGFSRVVQIDASWPEPGSKVVWESGAAGRGRVTERVVELTGTTFETQVFEEQLSGRQMLHFDVGEVVMELEYELQKGGPLRGLTDALFIRRALSDMLARTLRRFSTEAAEEAAL